MDDELVGEALEPGCLADRDGSVLVWMGVLTRLGIAEPGDDGPRNSVPGHAPVPAGVILAQGTLHASGQEIPRQIAPVLARAENGKTGQIGCGQPGSVMVVQLISQPSRIPAW